MSRKQNINTRSSTEAELVAADDTVSQILWMKLFLEEQGIEIKKNILCQDNQSTILLEQNGKRSSGECTQHLNVCCFFLTNQIKQGNMNIECHPTDELIGDFIKQACSR